MDLDYSFNAFEAVLTYAIDRNYGDCVTSTLLSELLLNENTFFSELYLDRPKENEIMKYLSSSYQPILVYGSPGTGKTSVVRKCIRDFSQSKNTCQIRFDFKGLETIDIMGENFKIENWHREYLKAKLIHYIMSMGHSDYDIVKFFLKEKQKDYEMQFDFENIKQEIFNDYKFRNITTGFYEWFNEGLIEKKKEIRDIVQKLRKYLRNRDYLYYIHHYNEEEPTIIIISYDNLDSIISNEIRREFYKFIRSYAGVISHYAHMIITSRTSSIADQSLADYGAHDWHKVQIDYQEFIDQEKLKVRIDFLIKNKGYCTSNDKVAIERDLEISAMERFAREVISKRTVYLEKTIEEDSIKTKVNRGKLDEIKEIYSLIIHNHNIHGALMGLSNHDRNLMFRLLVRFISNIVYYLDIKEDELGETEDEKNFILESYFYHWTMGNEKIDTTYFNLVKDVQHWEKSRIGLGCSHTHLLLSAIYNLTKRVRGQHKYNVSTTVLDVLKKLGELGYSYAETRELLFNLYKIDDRYLGMIETSRYFFVSSVNDIKDYDDIWLTPRSAFICEYLSLKFLYMIALYRSNEITDFSGRKFDYDDKYPITLYNISTNLYFLINVAVSHYLALIEIKKRLSDKHNWYDYYRKDFCIRAHDDDPLPPYGDLQLNNILRSHIRFLRHQSSLKSYKYINEKVIQQYEILAKKYEHAVLFLRNNKPLVGKNYDEVKAWFMASINVSILSVERTEIHEDHR